MPTFLILLFNVKADLPVYHFVVCQRFPKHRVSKVGLRDSRNVPPSGVLRHFNNPRMDRIIKLLKLGREGLLVNWGRTVCDATNCGPPEVMKITSL